ncbi:LysR family transcriptional regulator [Streptomyces sp. NPDC021093]|uniref:LysR family transcriptional regulator n=1 Tax=Streptomyces sp. NPDC021093 TaxID=3365112 RepID=UPI0037881A89
MELRQLRYLVTVVEEANFTRAAARLHVAQPGVSAQIRRLERELGQALLDRTGRTVTLTEAGEAILPHARAVLAAADAVHGTADELTGLLRGRVRVGSLLGVPAGVFDLAGVLADFHDAHPGVEFSLTEDTSERLLAALHRGELDMVLASVADAQPPPGVAFQILLDEPLRAVTTPDDPLALPPERTGIPLAALRDRPLISLPAGTGVRGVLERSCAEAGFRPAVAFEASAPQVLLQLASRGLGVAVLPAGTVPRSGPHLRVLALEEPCPRARIALARRADGPTGSAARAFLRHLARALPEWLAAQSPK